jgi:hypothetical protein
MDTEKILGAIGELGARTEAALAELKDDLGRLHTLQADTRRDLGALDQKLARIQEALYFGFFKFMARAESEKLRSMLPDPPERSRGVG